MQNLGSTGYILSNNYTLDSVNLSTLSLAVKKKKHILAIPTDNLGLEFV